MPHSAVPDQPLILAFDTSAAHCAAVVLSGDRVLAQLFEPMEKGQGERLMGLLTEIMADADVALSDLNALAVGTGPGNFTGIRLSVSAARGLALALAIPAIGVTSLEAAAFGLPRPIEVILDARRGAFYVQRFDGGEATLVTAEHRPTSPVTGSGAQALTGHDSVIQQPLPIAETIARIAAQRLAAGETQTRPAPLYLRAPDAAPSRDVAPDLLDQPS